MAVDDVYTKSLLHLDGADGSTTFTDESGKSWSRSGSAQIDTAQSVFGGASGLFASATSDYIYTADHADWQLDGGSNSNEWTIDFRVRFNGDPGTNDVGLVSQQVDATHFWAIHVDAGTGLRFRFVNATAKISITNSWNPATDTWYHIAVVKQGTTGYKMFVNGSQIGTTQTDTDTLTDLAGTLYVGKYTDTASSIWYLNGWLDELRISKGVSRWTSNFTPPTAAYAPPLLVVADTSHALTSESNALTQHNILTVADASHASTSDNVSLTQHNALVVADAAHVLTSDNVTVTAHDPAGVSVTVQDAAHVLTSDEVSLVQHHVLAVDDTGHVLTSDNADLVQHYVLLVDDAGHALVSDNAVLVQHFALSVDDSYHMVYSYIQVFPTITFKARDTFITFPERERENTFAASSIMVNLTDESGNYLTDENGNRFVLPTSIDARPVIIRFKQRDTNLIME